MKMKTALTSLFAALALSVFGLGGASAVPLAAGASNLHEIGRSADKDETLALFKERKHKDAKAKGHDHHKKKLKKKKKKKKAHTHHGKKHKYSKAKKKKH